MSTSYRVRKGMSALAVAGGAVLAAAPAAHAAGDPLPTPAAPHLVSAVVVGCHAPCAPGQAGEVVLTFTNPTVGSDVFLSNWAYANGFRLGSTDIRRDGDTVEMHLDICAAVNLASEQCTYRARVDALRGAELMTVTATAVTGNPDDGTQRISAESAPSNGLVPSQR